MSALNHSIPVFPANPCGSGISQNTIVPPKQPRVDDYLEDEFGSVLGLVAELTERGHQLSTYVSESSGALSVLVIGPLTSFDKERISFHQRTGDLAAVIRAREIALYGNRDEVNAVFGPRPTAIFAASIPTPKLPGSSLEVTE